MNMSRVVAATVFSLVLAGVVQAQKPGPAPGLGLLETVRWAGPPVSPNMLQGKTALVLVYATWCPKCNEWSGELFQQLKQAASDKPVVILAINADKSPAGVQQYLTARGFFAPNIFHGYDPAAPARLGFDSNLFYYAIFSPEGAVSGQGQAGGFFNSPQGKRFALPAKLAEAQNLGSFRFIEQGMPAELTSLLWPLELGEVSEAALRAVQSRLTPEQRKQVEAATARFLDGRIAFIRERYKGALTERMEAYEAAVDLTTAFRGTPQNQTARQVVQFMEADGDFKREVAAKRVYESTMQTIAENPRRRKLLLKSVAQRFEGTHFGTLAAEALAEEGM